MATIVEGVLGVFHGFLSKISISVGNDSLVDLSVVAGND
jgi:hypothetical protein